METQSVCVQMLLCVAVRWTGCPQHSSMNQGNCCHRLLFNVLERCWTRTHNYQKQTTLVLAKTIGQMQLSFSLCLCVCVSVCVCVCVCVCVWESCNPSYVAGLLCFFIEPNRRVKTRSALIKSHCNTHIPTPTYTRDCLLDFRFSSLEKKKNTYFRWTFIVKNDEYVFFT